MRRFILVTGCLAFTFTGAAVHATDCNVPKVACCPSCDAPTPQQCTCSRPAQPQPAATPQSGTRPAQGGYVTPPHRGTYAGETSSLGLDIGGIHVPEMHFHLPTLRLPGLRHLRRNPEFLGDAHTAPYVTAPISQFAGTPQAGTRPASPQPDEGTPKEQSGTRPSSCTVPKAPAAEAALNQRLHHLTEQMTRLQAVVEILATRQVAAVTRQEDSSVSQVAAPTLIEVPIQNSQFESIQFEPVVIETTHQSEASSSIREEGTARDLEQAYQAKCIEAEQTQAQLLELQRQVAELVARQKNSGVPDLPPATNPDSDVTRLEPLWLTPESDPRMNDSTSQTIVMAEHRSDQEAIDTRDEKPVVRKQPSRFRRVLQSVWKR